MDELKLISERTGSVQLAETAALAAARARLMTEIATAEAENVVPLQKRRRWAWTGAGVVGLAAAITAVVALAPVEQVGLEPPAAAADPVVVLRNAAAAALKTPDVPPRPGQFVYTKTKQPDGERESWLSADGTRDGMIKMADGSSFPVPGCRNGRAQVYKGEEPVKGVTEPCTPRPVHRADLPTDADAMFAYLNADRSGQKGDFNAMGKDVLALANESFLSPEVRAALYGAAAKVPGLRAVEHAEDAAGRPGVGITWPLGPHADLKVAKPVVIVFSADTFSYLGTNSTAVTASGVVDAVGQRPRG
ncbi:CU044_5270 family protein [Amycolatopsis pittospori]|uniref:CU044_5270 family protein n=1 Tax=Amycolatopsis pittospori TaxID=2749434 RepID=UPI0015F01A73|nr:CU044_5270 family protein [Amycolatopsis pittospori]